MYKQEPILKENSKAGRFKHGFCGTRFHTLWKAMRQRCLNPNIEHWDMYGGCGITICDRWIESFENFKDDMYTSYLEHVKEFGEKNTSLDRINSKQGYSKENCKWSTRREQSQNTRTCFIFKTVDYKAYQYWKVRWQSYLNSCINKKINSPKFLYVFGLDFPSFVTYIESKFLPGMTWKNHGRGNGKWQFDHIIPCNQFDLSIEKERLDCFNYKNIQPLWWFENSVTKRKKDTLLYA
jgi:hypothetical protein